MEIIAFNSNNDIRVKFLDEHGIEVSVTYSNFKRGCIKNPYDISVYGIGYIGEGKYMAKKNGKCTPEYHMWISMLQRCYSEKWKDKFPAYYGLCTVCDEWLNYQTFAGWYDKNYYPVPKRLHLDKDIILEGNKVYSPETCILVPQRINMLFISKRKDEEYISHIERVLEEYSEIVSAKVRDAILSRVESMRHPG